MVGNAIDCDCFRRGNSGRADSLNRKAIASETEVFLAAPIGGAGRELIALARTANNNSPRKGSSLEALVWATLLHIWVIPSGGVPAAEGEPRYAR